MKSLLPPNLLGEYINPDEIELQIKNQGFLDFQQFGIDIEEGDVLGYLVGSSFLKSAGFAPSSGQILIDSSRLIFEEISVNSYYASVIADFIRRELLRNGRSFTFETVMSSPDKVELLREAKRLGFRTYLYYIATEDPLINIARVQSRVSLGGHAVPEEKILARYARSLELLLDAIRATNRAYIFDNSGSTQIWLAEITDGYDVKLKSASLPQWFRTAILDKDANSTA